MDVRAVALVGLLALTPGCTWLTPSEGPGFLGAKYLTNSGTLWLEIDTAPNATPNPEALALIVSTLQQVTGRTVTRVGEAGELPARGARHGYTFDEIRALSRDSADRTGADGDVMHILYLDGLISNGQSTDIVGLAFDGRNIAMAKGKIRDASCTPAEEVPLVGTCPNGQPKEANVERAVLMHEAGHLLGLVDCGIPMQKDRLDRDPEHGICHSTNESSVMHWAVEVGVGIQNLIDGGRTIPFQFDGDDKADLAAAKRGG